MKREASAHKVVCRVQLSECRRRASVRRRGLARDARLLQDAGEISRVVRRGAVSQLGEPALVQQRDAFPAAHSACPDLDLTAQSGEKDIADPLPERLAFEH